MTYEIWDRASGNRLGLFSSREEAFELVREIEEEEGHGAAEALALGFEDDAGHSVGQPIGGARLVEMARRVSA